MVDDRAQRGGYNHPPIVEAVISVEYERLAAERLPEIRAFCAGLLVDYPNQTALVQQQAQVQLGPVVGYTTTQQEEGVVCSSADRKRFVQVGLSSSAFSRLAPYTSWEDFESEVRPLWERFDKAMSVTVTTLGLRYINRIEIPAGTPMEYYLRTYPEVSRDLPQLIGPYFMKLEIPMVDSVGEPVLTVQQGFVQSSNPETYAILLDNDLRYKVQSSAEVWDLAQDARREKNRIFEACITDQFRERLN